VRIEFPAHALLRLLPFVSNEETRYYLNGVKVEAKTCVATDCHRLGAISAACTVDLDGTHFTHAIVRPLKELVAYAKKAIKLKPDAVIVLTGDSKRQTASFVLPIDPKAPDKDRSLGLPSFTDDFLIDGTFPDWVRALPTSDPATLIPVADAFNAKCLGDFALASRQRLEYPKTGTAVHVLSDSFGSPAWVFTNDADFVGVIMPIRTANPSVRPAWLPGAPAAAAEPLAAE